MIDFTVPEKQSYSTRRNKSIVLIVLMVTVLLLFGLLIGHDMIFISILLSFLCFVQLYKFNKTDRYFIKHIKIQNENVEIIYKDKNNEILFTGRLDHMIIKKKEDFLARRRTVYLAIYNENQLLLDQFIQSEWTEAKFNEIEQYIRKYQIIGSEIG